VSPRSSSGDDFTIIPGEGYLLKNGTAFTWTYQGTPLTAVDVDLVNGWNLVGLPIEPVTRYTASTMAAEVNAQGGNVTQVFHWNANGGRWDFYLVDTQVGDDFAIELGEGYLLKSEAASTWTVVGSGGG
jgi:hypothetical protein